MTNEKKPKKAGRKTKLNRQLIDDICKLIRNNMYVSRACQFLGISETIYYAWINEGNAALERQQTGQKLSAKDNLFLEFLKSVKKAESQSQAAAVTGIIKAGSEKQVTKRVEHRNKDGEIIKVEETYSNPQWQALAWLLERRFQNEWGRKERLEVDEFKSIEVSGNVSINKSSDTKEYIDDSNTADILDIMAEVGAIPPPQDNSGSTD